MDEIHLSEYGDASVTPAPVSRMMASFAADFRDGVDINLGVGYVNEKTIPRDLIEQSLHEVIANPQRHRAALNYGGPKGSKNLITSIKEFLTKHRIGNLSEQILSRNEIIIGPSGATSLLEAIANVLGPRKAGTLPKGLVIMSDPIYYIYSNFLERMGFEIAAVPEGREGINIELLEKKLDQLGDNKKDISFLYIVTVSNPTCTILSSSCQRHLIDITNRLSKDLGRKVPLFLDKAYENLIHDPDVPERRSALLYDELGVVYEIYTLSKILAPALRIGYMIGRGCAFTEVMIQRTSDVGFSAPLICQEIASHILDHHAASQMEKVKQGYHEKAIQTKKWIDEFLGDSVTECRGGQAGFYYYLTFDDIETNEDSPFFKFLTRTTGLANIDGPAENKNPRVLYIPGQYCVHKRGSLTEIGKRQLRLSYGFEELDNIHKAIQLMQEAIIYSHSL
ncbi:MAG: pyridoxal phosphate-dependent aminotransferase [Phycisphaerae bacterium]